jgi:phosphonate transport system ATP-binding protein
MNTATSIVRPESATEPAVLSVRGLCVNRGDCRAVRHISFPVRPGEFVGVLGRSGAGKTTLLHTLAGLNGVHDGEVNWNGSRFAMLFQHYRLVPQMTALTNVACGRLGAHPWWRTLAGLPEEEKQRARYWLDAVGLSGKADRPVRTLSGGERQRVAVARALIQEPSVLLADEPVAALDAETANEIMALLQSLNRERGVTVLCVLHDLEMAERFTERVLLLDQGRLVFDGASRNLQSVIRDRLKWKTLL